MGSAQLQFYPGVSYRNLLVYRGAGRPAPFSPDTRTTPPHDLTDKSVLDDYPRGPGSDLLNHLMSESVTLFAEHPVNVARRAAGKPPATNVWLWGLGSTPQLDALRRAVRQARGDDHGRRSAARPGRADRLAADRSARRHRLHSTPTTPPRAAMPSRRSSDVDLVCVHVEATDEASHEGNAAAKVKALEEIDRHIVGPLHEALKKHGEYRILVTPDHPTPLRTKTHSHGYVPFAMAGSGIAPDAAATYDDPTADRSSLVFRRRLAADGPFSGRSLTDAAETGRISQ